MGLWLGPEEATALLLSLRVSLAATLASLPLAAPRGLRAGPLALPRPRRSSTSSSTCRWSCRPVVTGYLLLETFGLRGPGGRAPRTTAAASSSPSAGPARRSPPPSWPSRSSSAPSASSIEAVPRPAEESAADLGARPAPRVPDRDPAPRLPGLLAGAALGFARAMGEFGATITFVLDIPGETQTLPSAIHALLQVPGGEPAAAPPRRRLAVPSRPVAILLAEWSPARRRRPPGPGPLGPGPQPPRAAPPPAPPRPRSAPRPARDRPAS